MDAIEITIVLGGVGKEIGKERQLRLRVIGPHRGILLPGETCGAQCHHEGDQIGFKVENGRAIYDWREDVLIRKEKS